MELMRGGNWFKALLLLSLSLVFVSCGGGGVGSSSGGTRNSSGSNITVAVSPPSATLSPGGTQLYTATVTGATDTSVTWSANNVQGGNATVGTINSSGLYTAPA